MGGAVVQQVERWTCDSKSPVQILLEATPRNNLGQVVHTYVPLSPSSITWYRHSAPAVWNSLPKTVLDSSSLTLFKSRLKSHLFHLAYNDRQ